MKRLLSLLSILVLVGLACQQEPIMQSVPETGKASVKPNLAKSTGEKQVQSLEDITQCTSGHMGPAHQHETSYDYANCHGYAMRIKLGGGSSCVPARTIASSISTAFFQNYSYSFSSLQTGDIVSWPDHSAIINFRGLSTSLTKISHANFDLNGLIRDDDPLQFAIDRLGPPTTIWRPKTSNPCTPPPPTPPAAPFINTAIYQNHPQIYWNAVSGATGYKIYRAYGSATGSYVLIATITATSYTDTGHTIYSGIGAKVYVYYKVKAYNSGGDSPYSNYRQFTCNSDL